MIGQIIRNQRKVLLPREQPSRTTKWLKEPNKTNPVRARTNMDITQHPALKKSEERRRNYHKNNLHEKHKTNPASAARTIGTPHKQILNPPHTVAKFSQNINP
jgi:hypothetical protein